MRIEDVIEKLEQEKNNLRFDYLVRVCQEYFGNPRYKGSHQIYKIPWAGDPRINLQENKRDKGKAMPYQVKQVVTALRRLQEMRDNNASGEAYHAE